MLVGVDLIGSEPYEISNGLEHIAKELYFLQPEYQELVLAPSPAMAAPPFFANRWRQRPVFENVSNQVLTALEAIKSQGNASHRTHSLVGPI
jgi:hypothetical protein